MSKPSAGQKRSNDYVESVSTEATERKRVSTLR